MNIQITNLYHSYHYFFYIMVLHTMFTGMFFHHLLQSTRTKNLSSNHTLNVMRYTISRDSCDLMSLQIGAAFIRTPVIVRQIEFTYTRYIGHQ